MLKYKLTLTKLMEVYKCKYVYDFEDYDGNLGTYLSYFISFANNAFKQTRQTRLQTEICDNIGSK